MPASQVAENTSKISFADDLLAQHAATILADGGPRAIRRPEKWEQGQRPSVVFVARHEDAKNVLSDEKKFSLQHYEKLFGAIAPEGVKQVMINRVPRVELQRRILMEAAGRMAHKGLHNVFVRPERHDSSVVPRAVQSVLDSIRARAEPEFDIIGEYGYFVPYLVARELFGLPGPSDTGFLVNTLAVARRWSGSLHRFTPETTPLLTSVYLAQLILLQLFGNFDNRTAAFRWLGGYGTKRLVKHIQKRLGALRGGYDPYPHSLLNAFLAARNEFPDVSDDEYETFVVSLVLELFGTALLVPGGGVGGIIAWMSEQPGGIERELQKLKREDAPYFVDEFLRLAPPTERLLRTATEALAFGDFQVHEGEYVCVLLKQACRDTKAFSAPDTFQKSRERSAMLHFGPEGGPHHCLGRELSRELFAEMLLGLKDLPGLHAYGNVENVLGFKQLKVRWNRVERMTRSYGPHRSSGGDNG